ncbi:MAG TPA: glycosyltransferase family 39 protein [Acidimicrobiales bacterium]|jgi:4-amino-4-deoxy-L-arabinose transferase-like glycosyltransferase
MTDTTMPPAGGGGVGLLEPPRPVDPFAAPPTPPSVSDPAGPRSGRLSRFVRGKETDPVWVRPALLTLLVATAVLYLWDLGASGWSNSFYAAAVQAGTKSWKAMFFGSSDSSNFITVDKPPMFLWPMEISARIFGLNSWSMLVPQALEGVATVGVVYLTVRRWFSAQAALLAGVVLAVTPVAALMFRYNNPDALLALLMAGAIYCTVRALERAQTKWVVFAGALIGFGFITKMMQAFLIVPAMVIVYLLAAPTPWWRRVRQVVLMGVATLVAGGWWVLVDLVTPASDRPYVGGSQNNSILNLIFGYNGFGRLTGSESGSVGGHATAASSSMWGPTGITRLFNTDFGNMMSWLLPAALVMGAVLLVVTIRAKRTDRERAALLLWGGALVGTGLVISLGQGIIHPYYTVALAPLLAGLIGVSTFGLWQRRDHWYGRVGLAAGLGVTMIWGYELLDRTPTWFPALRTLLVVAGALAIAGILALPLLKAVPKWLIAAIAVLGLGGALITPLFSTVATAATPHNGAIPSVTPTPTGGQGGPGGGGFPGGGAGGFRGGLGRGTGGTSTGGFPGGTGARPSGGFPGGGGGFAGGAPSTGKPGTGGFTRGGGFGGAGGGAGFLSSSTPGQAITAMLEHDASQYTWVAATVNSNNAAGYQLASDDPVMAIGGFNGTDPAPSLAQFEKYVEEGKIHYFIADGSGGFGGGAGSSSTDDASKITAWVESHFTSETVDGTTIYDLTSAQK